MSVDVRSRPSLRRRILGAFERATSPSPPPPASRSHTTSVLRKKRRNTTTTGPSSPMTYEPPVPPFVHHTKQASDSGVRYHSSSSRSSSELHTPSSDRRVLGDWGNSPTSSHSSLHRHGALSAPVVHGALGPSAYSPHQHHPILFPVSDDEYSPRSHSSSDYYRVSPTSATHARCFSQPTGQLYAAQPSTHSLRSVDLNRDLPPLPGDVDKCIPLLPHTSASGLGGPNKNSEEQHGARATSEEGFLLAPGTFARVVGDDYDYYDEDDTAENRDCDDQCCRSVEPVLDPATAPSRRNSLPARLSIPLDGLKSVPVKLHDITPCDETPRPDGLMAVFDRSPGAGPRPRNRAFQEAILMAEDDQKQSFLARASSLTRATSLTLKNVARRRSTKRATPPTIDEDVRTVAV